ncbi:branched-chain amino acid ABC transporter permease [Georhizobium profundi]|jgi:branched-chain amino acid transport system permease protein|uniref:Branched-chain amino acid ABC transporter permease n=1 Tax=Georhizobium profundi TaxID=2341112 RepID=A0A3Q8XNF7_9HYPH|nr:branched-chain amino acid ABC transporter permease [Georhizobium profundi]AZN71626.1 branched-chain amino acid ABC transporter permease [Georhizobium profundi]GLQ37650.1 branched-chain amino acid ABC transporter permease [Rhizobium albus]
MNELVFFINKGILAGAIIGSIYALGAIGVTLIFGILRFAHFAHGDMMTLGAFIAYVLAAALAAAGFAGPLPIAMMVLPIVMILTAGISIGIDRTFYQPLRRSGAKGIVLVMASIGVTLMLQGLIRLFAGPSSRELYFNEPKDIFRIEVPGANQMITVTEPQLALFIVTLISVIALHYFLSRSRLGKAMRAVSDNPSLAQVTGISIETVVRATWIIGGGLAALAGTMLALDVSLKPDLSFNILLPIFAATIVGGIGQPYGAIAGGFVVGYAETLAVFNWSVLLRPIARWTDNAFEVPASLAIVPTDYKLMVPFVLLILILIYRPTGIFKGRVL